MHEGTLASPPAVRSHRRDLAAATFSITLALHRRLSCAILGPQPLSSPKPASTQPRLSALHQQA